mgnify:CR=1 FL=1
MARCRLVEFQALTVACRAYGANECGTPRAASDPERTQTRLVKPLAFRTKFYTRQHGCGIAYHGAFAREHKLWRLEMRGLRPSSIFVAKYLFQNFREASDDRIFQRCGAGVNTCLEASYGRINPKDTNSSRLDDRPQLNRCHH